MFHALDQKNIQAIAKIQLRVLEARLEKMDMKLEVSSRGAGASSPRRASIRCSARGRSSGRSSSEIENPVAKLILEGRFGPKDVIPVDYEDGRFVFERVVH